MPIFKVRYFLYIIFFMNSLLAETKRESSPSEIDKQMKSLIGRLYMYKKCLTRRCTKQEYRATAKRAFFDGAQLAIVGGAVWLLSNKIFPTPLRKALRQIDKKEPKERIFGKDCSTPMKIGDEAISMEKYPVKKNDLLKIANEGYGVEFITTEAYQNKGLTHFPKVFEVVKELQKRKDAQIITFTILETPLESLPPKSPYLYYTWTKNIQGEWEEDFSYFS